jgi:hypothetical protein
MLKTKIDKYDQTFSKFIRLRDQVCQRCGKTGRLECSHIFSRRHQGTRYDPGNAKALCFTCHRYWHENPIEAVEWLKGIIGQARYDRLRLKANKPTKLSKWDKDHIRDELLVLIKRIEAGETFVQFKDIEIMEF